MMDIGVSFAMQTIEVMAVAFISVVGLLVLIGLILFVIDRSQTGDAIRRNYPVIGRFRHIFTELGEFFRQYFFAMDREELPFNRAQRDWVKRARPRARATPLPSGQPATSTCRARRFS